MSFYSSELISLRLKCNHPYNSNKLKPLGYAKWSEHPEKSIKFYYCSKCLNTQIELIELNQDSVNALKRMRLGAAFNFEVPHGVTLVDHMKSFRSILRSLHDYIIDEIGELPKELELVVSPEVMGYLELALDRTNIALAREDSTKRILNTPITVNTNVDSSSCKLMYGHHTICKLALHNVPFRRPGKQVELFESKNYDVVRIQL